MLTYGSLFEQELRKLLQERMANLADQVISGLGIDDHAKYRQMVGEIQGLRSAIELCDEANSICARRERE